MAINHVPFRGEYVEPFGADLAPITLASWYLIFFVVTVVVLKVLGKKKLATRWGITGIAAAVGSVLGVLIVGIPITIFSEFVYPLADSFTSLGGLLSGAVGAGWCLHMSEAFTNRWGAITIFIGWELG